MKKIKKFKEYDDEVTYEPLTDDITALEKIGDEYVKITEPVKIVKIIDIITDEKEIAKIEEAFQLDTSLTIKNVKRGDVIWLTALLEKPNSSTAWNAQTISTVKCRIIDIFYGLNKLKTIK